MTRSLVRTAGSDRRAWLELGPGGLPYSTTGWLIATALRPLKRETLSVRPYPAAAGAGARPLPRRTGSRPRIAHHPIPHRQLDQLHGAGTPRNLLGRSQDLLRELAASRPDRFVISRSRFERRGDALFAAGPASGTPWADRSKGELAHVHPYDGSWHMVFSAADAADVITAGWGERHPLDGVPLLGLPMTYLLVYAARDEDELAVVEQLLRRAAGVSPAQ